MLSGGEDYELLYRPGLNRGAGCRLVITGICRLPVSDGNDGGYRKGIAFVRDGGSLSL